MDLTTDYKLPDLISPPERRYFIVDTRDLTEKAFEQLKHPTDHSVVLPNTEAFDLLMHDIHWSIERLHRPAILSKDIDQAIKGPFTVRQRLIWRQFAYALIERYQYHRLYDDESTNTHEFVRMMGPNVLLRYYDAN